MESSFGMSSVMVRVDMERSGADGTVILIATMFPELNLKEWRAVTKAFLGNAKGVQVQKDSQTLSAR